MIRVSSIPIVHADQIKGLQMGNELQSAGNAVMAGAVHPNPLTAVFLSVLDQVEAKPFADPFKYPVDTTAYPGYTQCVSNPMDLSTIRAKVLSNAYSTAADFQGDIDLMVANCKTFNSPQSRISKEAQQIAKLVQQQLRLLVPAEPKAPRKPPRSRAAPVAPVIAIDTPSTATAAVAAPIAPSVAASASVPVPRLPSAVGDLPSTSAASGSAGPAASRTHAFTTHAAPITQASSSVTAAAVAPHGRAPTSTSANAAGGSVAQEVFLNPVRVRPHSGVSHAHDVSGFSADLPVVLDDSPVVPTTSFSSHRPLVRLSSTLDRGSDPGLLAPLMKPSSSSSSTSFTSAPVHRPAPSLTQHLAGIGMPPSHQFGQPARPAASVSSSKKGGIKYLVEQAKIAQERKELYAAVTSTSGASGGAANTKPTNQRLCEMQLNAALSRYQATLQEAQQRFPIEQYELETLSMQARLAIERTFNANLEYVEADLRQAAWLSFLQHAKEMFLPYVTENATATNRRLLEQAEELKRQNAQLSRLAEESKRKRKQDEEPNICTICCSEKKNRMLPCGHVFCETCVAGFRQNSMACPNCKRKIAFGQVKTVYLD